MTRPEAHAASLLCPGSNCWVCERADRVRIVQDGDYYRLFRDAVLRAERTVFILAWDINAGTQLTPDEPHGQVPSRLDAFLIYAARRRPKTKFYILTWDYGLLFALERDPFTRWRLGWLTPRNVKLAFDDHHPLGACHHQKVVVIDDTLAFSGSMDLTAHRWDTPAHRVDEPGRKDPLGRPYEPYHEVMAMIEGPAVARLGELVRDRWRAVGARRVPRAAPARPSLWPEHVQPDFTDVEVGIMRTMPGTATRPGVCECEHLYLDAIAAARRTLYIENQYFTHPGLADALARRLREPDGPEVVLVLPFGGDGWLEENTIRVIRDSLFQRLTAADAHDRLRIVYPAASRARDVTTFVHSKVLIADDTLLIVGSANTNRRSMGMDTECDIAVIAKGRAQSAAIAAVRHRLAGEHLGLEPDQVACAIRDAGSLRQLIDQRQLEDRTLARFEIAAPAAPLDDTVQAIVDPEAPIGAGGGVVPAPDLPDPHTPLPVWVAPAVALLSVAIVGWSVFHSPGRSALLTVRDTIEAARATPLPDAWPMVLLAVASQVLVPLELALLFTGAIFGAVRGIAVAAGAALGLAIVGYVAGRLLGPQAVRRVVSRKSFRSVRQLEATGMRGVAMLRLAGVASPGVVHLLSGAGRMPFGSYLAGTALGIGPAIIALAVLGALLGDLVLAPALPNAVGTVLAALVVLGCALALRAFLQIRQFAPAMSRQRARAEAG
jgi:phosphatidylserine/phosphatidylglycerophosphate/cardiolipin synthase-like enzyme/uncharacterized membrane protein YdjX (TVP38/TMEM64 family)